VIRPRRVLVLYRLNEPKPYRPAITHHLYALQYASRAHDVFYYNAVAGVPSWLRTLAFDAVILHTTFVGMRWSDTFPRWKWDVRWLSDLDCPKIALPQDEYDYAHVLDEWLYELGVTDVFSVFDEPLRRLIYPLTGNRARFHRCLTGYIDDVTAEQLRPRRRPLRERPRDVVYRVGAYMLHRYGRLGQLKSRVAAAVDERAPAHGLAADISTRAEDAFHGDAWLDFMLSAKSTLGTESGAGGLDRRGELRARVESMLTQRPGLSFEEMSGRLPAGWDEPEFAAVSPRHFEAVITGTAQILVEGRYDGIFEADRHYLPLRRDFSNLDEVLERSKDVDLLQDLADRAYEEIYVSGRYSYRQFAARLEGVVQSAEPRPAPRALAARRAAVDAAVRAQTAFENHKPRTLTRLVEAPRSSVRKGVIAVRLALGTPARRRLLIDFACQAPVRRGLTTHHLLADLLRLAVLESRRRSFPLEPVLEDDGRKLMLYSRTGDTSPDGVSASAADVDAALRSGSVQSIVWDHSALGSHVPLPEASASDSPLRVGIADSHRFEALAAVMRSDPALGAELVREVLSV
jgi:hypothetical protein